MSKRKLGKGLGAIISNSSKPAEDLEEIVVGEAADRVVDVPLKDIEPNPDQPRTHFDEDPIEELAASIKSVGLIQPIILRKDQGQYYIIAGERRYRASKVAGKNSIKAIVMEATEEENLTLALVENIQREALDPIEEAKAYKALATRFKLKQQDIAKRVGKDRATVANLIRLLTLPESIQQGLSEGAISTGHAKLLLSVSNDEKKIDLYGQIVSTGMSVRALEKMVSEVVEKEEPVESISAEKDAHLRSMEEKLVSLLGTKVEIRHAGSRGKIEISYYSLDDFERIIERLS